VDLEQIKELMSCLEDSKLSKLIFKTGDIELHLEKDSSSAAPIRTISIPSSENIADSAFHSDIPLKGERGAVRKEEPAGAYVTSPMVGTFYSCPAPDQPPFAKVGDQVEPDTIVCIIEAMKVLNEVKAGIRGTVSESLIRDSEPVEFGSRLFRIT